MIKYEDLEAQRPAFASRPELLEYLLAAHRFYVENDPAGALGHLGAAPLSGPMTSFAFSPPGAAGPGAGAAEGLRRRPGAVCCS
ncbi:MAG: hypothetical protein WDM85_13465 [Caulobacteraceae bacterium]